MAATQFPISNIVDISVSAAQPGVGAYNTSNLALFTSDPFQESFGSLGYQIYTSPLQVALDFGTQSQTYLMATAVFSQQPNILAGGGYLVIIPFVNAEQTLTLSGVPASGAFTITWSGFGTTATINWNDSATVIQGKIQAVTGLPEALVTGSLAGESLVINFVGVYGPVPSPTFGGAGLLTSGSTSITITPVQTTVGETMSAAIIRTETIVQYFGLMATVILSQADVLAAAATVQAINKIFFVVSATAADLSGGGTLVLIQSGTFTQTRGLYYGSPLAPSSALLFQAAYAGAGLSVNFNGSNTTLTMNLKTLNTIQPDPTLTSAQLTLAETCGADVYISLQGVPKVISNGANSYFDEVYNLQSFVGALQVAGFNYLATVATKIPQTESGMDGLKNAYRQVCEQYVANQYIAPGQWNSATTFGNLTNFLNNITQKGYYIYSTPVAQQSQASRVARQAPVVQIAVKEAGAIQSSTVIVYVNQ